MIGRVMAALAGFLFAVGLAVGGMTQPDKVIGFPDFTGAPSRNENLISAGVSLEKALSKQRSITTFFNYDRFDSPNPDFKAGRYTTGVFATFRH